MGPHITRSESFEKASLIIRKFRVMCQMALEESEWNWKCQNVQEGSDFFSFQFFFPAFLYNSSKNGPFIAAESVEMAEMAQIFSLFD